MFINQDNVIFRAPEFTIQDCIFPSTQWNFQSIPKTIERSQSQRKKQKLTYTLKHEEDEELKFLEGDSFPGILTTRRVKKSSDYLSKNLYENYYELLLIVKDKQVGVFKHFSHSEFILSKYTEFAPAVVLEKQ